MDQLVDYTSLDVWLAERFWLSHSQLSHKLVSSKVNWQLFEDLYHEELLFMESSSFFIVKFSSSQPTPAELGWDSLIISLILNHPPTPIIVVLSSYRATSNLGEASWLKNWQILDIFQNRLETPPPSIGYFRLIWKLLTPPLSDQFQTFLNLRTYWWRKTPGLTS